MVIRQKAAGYRAQQNSHNRRRFNQPVGFHQLLTGGQLTKDPVFCRGIGRRPDPDQPVSQERIRAEADHHRAEQLTGIRQQHHPPFREAVGNLSDKRCQHNKGQHKDHLQHWLAPFGIVPGAELCKDGEQNRVIRKCRNKLGNQYRFHAFVQ